MILFLLVSPWLALLAFFLLVTRPPRRVPPFRKLTPEEAPLVSVIVPARNEERNMEALLASLAALEYPCFEVIVVDDRSTDGTSDLVRTADPGNSRGIRLVEGQPLPPGWFGKPWACFQGALEARGDLLLFTDADTVHHPELLTRSVLALEEDDADALTLLGRQVMESFWEKLLQPHFFMLLGLRYPRNRWPKQRHRWRDAIANGQYILFRRENYEEVGGHEVVRGEVVEDMRLAQLLVQGGWRLSFRAAPDCFQTRMYQSLADIVEGWGKNITTGSLQATPRWMRPVALPVSLAVGVTLWFLPPIALAWVLLDAEGELLRQWAFITTGTSAFFWAMISLIVGASPLYGVLYPLGAALSAYTFVKSWTRGSEIEWKRRTYRLEIDGDVGRGTLMSEREVDREPAGPGEDASRDIGDAAESLPDGRPSSESEDRPGPT